MVFIYRVDQKEKIVRSLIMGSEVGGRQSLVRGMPFVPRRDYHSYALSGLRILFSLA